MNGICNTCKRESCHMRFDGCKTCDVYEGCETRYEKLFGTPEMAAQTMALQCFGAPSEACDTCVFGECDGKLRNSGTYPTVYDALLDWLRGDA